jgi:hypothetical protein
MQRIEAPHTLPPGGEEGTGTEAHNASKPDPAEDGLFAGAGQEDAGGAGGMAKARKRRVNPAVDLDAQADDGWSEGYGLAHNAARSELVRGGRLGPDLWCVGGVGESGRQWQGCLGVGWMVQNKLVMAAPTTHACAVCMLHSCMARLPPAHTPPHVG